MSDSRVDFVTGAPVPVSLDVAWIHGAPAGRRATDPPVQVHRADPHTVILRQSKSVNYEAPFQYLLFGNDRALLLDTGATADPAKFPLRATVDQLVAEWLEARDRPERWSLRLMTDRVETTRAMTGCDLRVRATAADIYVLLWNRPPSSEPDITGAVGLLDSWRERIRVSWS